MSLFQTKEWWGTRVSGDDEFDERHMCVAEQLLVNSESPSTSRIIVGSFGGYLRIYNPSRREYRPEDMVFEQSFGEPIIQVGSGYFSANQTMQMLAILFFKRLMVFECESIGEGRISLKKVSQCNLPRNAYNMCFGQFGGVQKDLICVQSCDGLLMIIESDQVTSQVQLESFILPSPISYNSATDQIIVQNSSSELEAFKISNIGAVSNSNGQKKLHPDWSINIGEQCLKMESVCRDHKVFDLIALTEEAIFVVTQTGQIRCQKRFEYPATNFFVNEVPEKHTNAIIDPKTQQPLRAISLIISSFTHHIMLYQDFQLQWATRTDHVCHGVSVGTFEGQRGLLVGLNEEGWLSVTYLGTDPPRNQLANFSQSTGSEQNINQISDSYEAVLGKIKDMEGKKPTSKRTEVTEVMNITQQITGPIPAYEYISKEGKYYCFDNGQVKCARVKLTLAFTGFKATDVQIVVVFPVNLESGEKKLPHYISEISGECSFEFPVYVLKAFSPSSTFVDVIITYHNSVPGKQAKKDPRSQTVQIDLPCALQCHLSVPIKNTNFKINLTTDLPCDNIAEVFADVIEKCPNKEQCLIAPNTFTFAYADGGHASILCSKQGDKYRIQSLTFQGIYFILSSFYDKIKKYQQGKKKVAEISFTEAVTFQDFFTVVDSHYMKRSKLQVVRQLLERKALEFRTIQKRLLTRFKEKNPAPINNLDILMQKSFDDLILLGNKYEQLQQLLYLESSNLSITVKLILWLFKIRFNLASETMKQLESAISSEITGDEEEIGWEEITNANVIYLLKVVMKKEMKETHLNIQKIDDFAKFKKHLTFVFDKIAKGHLEQP